MKVKNEKYIPVFVTRYKTENPIAEDDLTYSLIDKDSLNDVIELEEGETVVYFTPASITIRQFKS